MLTKEDFKDLQENLNNLLEQKKLNKELKTFIIRINKDKPEQLTEKEMDFLEEQYNRYFDKYENYAHLFHIAESISNIRNIYE